MTLFSGKGIVSQGSTRALSRGFPERQMAGG